MTQFDLHLGDCVAGMAQLEAASVDLVVTSPPYNLGIRYGKYTDTADRASYLDWCERWAAEVRRLLRPNGSLRPERSARRSATVTSSVLLASSASRINSLEANLPVPTSSREVNSRSAILSFDRLSDISLIYSAQPFCHPERSRRIPESGRAALKSNVTPSDPLNRARDDACTR